jgi:hypothetical protein
MVVSKFQTMLDCLYVPLSNLERGNKGEWGNNCDFWDAPFRFFNRAGARIYNVLRLRHFLNRKHDAM